jgi:hypothetical protein
MRSFFFFDPDISVITEPPDDHDRPARFAGRLLMGIALVHAAFGLWFGRAILADIARDGFLAAVDVHRDRQLVFWFLLASPLLWLLGELVAWLDARRIAPPVWLGLQVLALAIAGVLLMPASGFWLVLVPALLLLLASHRPVRN